MDAQRIKPDGGLLGKGGVAVKVQLPDESLQLMRDLHQDRQVIGWGLAILLGLLALVVFKHVLTPRKP
jgi:hypothetical protein